ncbi:MFS transporter [Virgisporangium aliadipatigenens]|uniref:MFS transporter n=1 Tax=Virgisporangium aliadipatigenens TaxID=741659 RepID=A0A8J3YRX4_9ACTN|nr:MFS transporter [Virgisporangium aliadipatigenens]GIJ49293.1 MFS transporter [Virgisporangium aliadipatigenens]
MRAVLRQLSPAGRLLIVNQFGIVFGFFLVLPFLATYLREELGLAAAVVGTVIGLRTLSQQGLFLVGGALADHWGPQRVIVLGCALRVLGFGALAATRSLPWIVAGTMVIGVAGALFSPASTTYLSHESPGRRAENFALYQFAGNAGALLGPLVGALLLAVDFRLVCGAAAAVFGALSVAQVLLLPYRAPQARGDGVLRSLWQVVRNRRFLVFALAGSVYFTLWNQLYLALPLEVERVTGRPDAVSAVFLVSTVVGIVFGVRLTVACRRRWSAGRSMATGLLLMGGGFVPAAVAAPFLATAAGPLDLAVAARAGAPVLAGTAVFSVGAAIANPFMMELIPTVGSERLVGTYFGWFNLFSSLAAAGASAAVGALIDLPGAALRCTPFALLVLLSTAGGAVIAVLQQRGRLESA